MNKLTIETCMSPYLAPLYELEGKVAVAIDIFRATSTICSALANGAQSIIPVQTIAECRAYANQDYLLVGERNGDKIEDFDLGNSPLKVTQEVVGGKSLVMTTTNGTRAIHAVKEADEVLIGSFLNLRSIASYIQLTNKPLVIMCAGRHNKMSAEDSLMAGALISLLLGDQYEIKDDASFMVYHLHQLFQKDRLAYLKGFERYAYFKQNGLLHEVDFCLSENLLDIVPIFNGENIQLG